jgi:hypothetical protein
MIYEMLWNDYEQKEDLKKLLIDKLNHLLEVAPSDANVTSEITKINKGYSGVLKIFSSQGKFVAETTAHNIEDLINTLLRLMYRQMKKWRKCRFLVE